ncbi:MAG: pilus assembly protein [Elusimicrobia bacterium]|nr:pilus assembly protein [Elusimicrobiota bacterium]
MRRKSGRRRGQVVVEMLLILPVFLGIVFTIMEIGYISFQLILLNHAAYEAVRVGGMTYYPSKSWQGAASVMSRILPGVTLDCYTEPTVYDKQAEQQNMDLVCKATENVQLIFPISNIILAKPRGTGKRQLMTIVRMPIERPLLK